MEEFEFKKIKVVQIRKEPQCKLCNSKHHSLYSRMKIEGKSNYEIAEKFKELEGQSISHVAVSSHFRHHLLFLDKYSEKTPMALDEKLDKQVRLFEELQKREPSESVLRQQKFCLEVIEKLEEMKRKYEKERTILDLSYLLPDLIEILSDIPAEYREKCLAKIRAKIRQS